MARIWFFLECIYLCRYVLSEPLQPHDPLEWASSGTAFGFGTQRWLHKTSGLTHRTSAQGPKNATELCGLLDSHIRLFVTSVLQVLIFNCSVCFYVCESLCCNLFQIRGRVVPAPLGACSGASRTFPRHGNCPLPLYTYYSTYNYISPNLRCRKKEWKEKLERTDSLGTPNMKYPCRHMSYYDRLF